MEKQDEQSTSFWTPWMAFDVTRAASGKIAPTAETMAQAAHLPIQVMFQQGGATQKMCSQVTAEMTAFVSRRTQAWSEAAGNACQYRNAQDAVAAMSSFWTQALKDQFETAQRIQAAYLAAIQPGKSDAPAETRTAARRELH